MSKKDNPRATIETLALGWPKCFSVFERRRRPLKVGLLEDLFALVGGSISRSALSNALHSYCSNEFYLRSMVEGADRIDLEGRPAGKVAKSQEAGAKRLLAAMAQRQERQAGTEKPPAPPAPTEAAGPKRLSLADLKAAWRARQAAREAAE